MFKQIALMGVVAATILVGHSGIAAAQPHGGPPGWDRGRGPPPRHWDHDNRGGRDWDRRADRRWDRRYDRNYGYGYGRPPPPAYYAPRPAYPPPGIFIPFR